MQHIYLEQIFKKTLIYWHFYLSFSITLYSSLNVIFTVLQSRLFHSIHLKNSIQFQLRFIYIATNHHNSHLKTL